jgi:hypothetical protein
VAAGASLRCSDPEHGPQDGSGSAARQMLLGFSGITEIMKEIIGRGLR